MANSKIEEAAEKYAGDGYKNSPYKGMVTKSFNAGALSDAAKEYWFEFNKYEGYENWNDERDCLKGEIQAYRKIISELDKELAQLKHQEQKPVAKAVDDLIEALRQDDIKNEDCYWANHMIIDFLTQIKGQQHGK